MTIVQEEIRLEGVSICEGIGLGVLFFLQPETDWAVPKFAITSSQVGSEIARYRRALSSSRKELEKLQFFLARDGSAEALSIIDTHIQMLEDPLMTEVMEQKIGLMRQNTESVFRVVMDDYRQCFIDAHKEKAPDSLQDFHDLSMRILKHLNPTIKHAEERFPSSSIACGYEISPSFAAEGSVHDLKGFISEIGGETSHTALIAKSKGIPYVSSINTHLLEQVEGKQVILDGHNGIVIVNPELQTLREYKKEAEQEKKTTVAFTEVELNEETADGLPIDIYANIECMNDLEKIQSYNVSGVGLVRTEFLFIQENIKDLNEERQLSSYKKILEDTPDIPITFRLFDFGSDKSFVEFDAFEPNPALGCRSIRYLLRFPHFLRTQFRALLKASIYGNVKIMLPFISDIEELVEVKTVFLEIQKELRDEGIDFAENVDLGCMVEVPSFALMADHFAKECDFFSIGTNDLVQYTLATDRCNPVADRTYHPAHPSILKLIAMTIAAANKEGIPVSLCGEVASNSLYAPLLVGLGLRRLSCSVRYIPVVRQTLKKFSAEEAENIAKKALELSSFHDVHQLLVDTFSHFSS